MVLSINTNVSALTASRNLRVNTQDTASSVSRLSSGSRVPQARDDAAALAIGSQLRAEVSALEQAAQNTIQAISLLQIADGALSTVGDVLVRQRALATQSASGQLADSERALLAQEFDNLTAEVDRISANTTFNGTQLLNGGNVETNTTELNAGGLSAVGITIGFNTNETGADEVFRVAYDYTNAATDTGNLTVTNVSTGESQTIDIADAIQAVTGEAAADLTTNLTAGNDVEINFDALGVNLTLNDDFDVDADFNATLAATTTVSGANLTALAATASYENGVLSGANFATLAGSASFDAGTSTLSLVVGNNASANTVDLEATTDIEFSTDGVNFSATLTGLVANDEVYVSVAGSNESFARVTVGAITSNTTTDNASGTIDLALDGIIRAQEVTGTAASFDFRVGTGTTANDDITVALTATTTTSLGTNGLSVATSTLSDTAIDALTSAINTLSSNRANIGASQSRLEFAAASIAVAIENTTAAQSGLLDVDVASEITAFTSSQVLVQAGISILSQANQQPNLFLQLLQ